MAMNAQKIKLPDLSNVLTISKKELKSQINKRI